MQAEEPKGGGGGAAGSGKSQAPHVNPPGDAYEELDDVMFDMTAPNAKQSNTTKGSKGHPQTPNTQNHTTYVNETGQTKDAWFRMKTCLIGICGVEAVLAYMHFGPEAQRPASWQAQQGAHAAVEVRGLAGQAPDLLPQRRRADHAGAVTVGTGVVVCKRSGVPARMCPAECQTPCRA